MRDDESGEENPTKGVKDLSRSAKWAALGSAMLTTGGLLIFFAYSYSPDALGRLSDTAFKAFPFLGLTFVASYFVFRFIGGWLGSARQVLAMGALLGGALASYGVWEGRPREWLRRLGINPPPTQLEGYHAWHAASFGDGHAYLFRFASSPAEFDALVAQLRLTLQGKAPANLPILTKAQMEEEGDPFPADNKLRRYFSEGYLRPALAEVWAAGEIIVVTDAARSEVYIYVDQWLKR